MTNCYRVPVRVNRRDIDGYYVVVTRPGPIIVAPTAEDAETKALELCHGWPDFAGVGRASLHHSPSRFHVPSDD